MHCQQNEWAKKKKGGWSILSVLFLIVTLTPSFALPKDPVRIYVFYSEESGGLKTAEELITPLSKKYVIQVNPLSVNQLNNYDLLTKFERQLKAEGLDLPVVVIGNQILGGEAIIRRDLERWVKSYSKKGTPWPSLEQTQPTNWEQWIPSPPTEEDQKSGRVIYAAFFYTPGCLACEETRAELEQWAPRFPDLRIRTFSLTMEENKKLDEALSQTYNVPASRRLAASKLYIGEDYLWADDVKEKNLQKLVLKYQGKLVSPPWEKVSQESLEKGEQSIVERFKSWSLSAVLIAGLIDGINPCAFATIIFLVSYLNFMGKKSTEILLYGITFTSGVFIAYLLAGMGLMTFLRELNGFPFIAQGIHYLIILFAFSLGLISMYDYILFRRGQMAKWTLQLPTAMKKKIHGIIREQVRSSRGGLLATFAVGFVIAGCQVICTAQVYLPTLGYIMTVPQLRVHALFNLLLYNIMFIIPLVGVFVSTFFGITSEKMAFVSKRHTGQVKLLTGILFVVLAGLLYLLP